MTVPSDMAERHGRQLARYAELALSLAEEVHAGAMAAPEPEQKARLAEAFHRLGRAMRQTMALESRFVRERARDLKADEAHAAGVRTAAVGRRREQVRSEVERAVYSELEGHEADTWFADFEERLEAETLEDAFLDEDLDAQVARLAANLGLTGEPAHNYVPRRLRRNAPPRFDVDAFYDDDEDEDEDDEPEADDGDADDPEPPADPPPPAPDEPPDDAPPEPETEPPPAPPPEPPPPDPPPRPPPPELPPSWDRWPNARFPGGSGY